MKEGWGLRWLGTPKGRKTCWHKSADHNHPRWPSLRRLDRKPSAASAGLVDHSNYFFTAAVLFYKPGLSPIGTAVALASMPAIAPAEPTTASEVGASVAGTAVAPVPGSVIEYYKKIMQRRGNKSQDIHKLEFGKFKGKPFGEVLVEEPSYCRWCLSHLDVENKQHKKFLDFIGESIKHASAIAHADTFGEGKSRNNTLQFGQFKGKSFGDVFMDEPAYCKWCVSHLDVDKQEHKEFLDFIKESMKTMAVDKDKAAGSGQTDADNNLTGNVVDAMQALLDDLQNRIELLEHTTVRRIKVTDMAVVEKLVAKANK